MTKRNQVQVNPSTVQALPDSVPAAAMTFKQMGMEAGKQMISQDAGILTYKRDVLLSVYPQFQGSDENQAQWLDGVAEAYNAVNKSGGNIRKSEYAAVFRACSVTNVQFPVQRADVNGVTEEKPDYSRLATPQDGDFVTKEQTALEFLKSYQCSGWTPFVKICRIIAPSATGAGRKANKRLTDTKIETMRDNMESIDATRHSEKIRPVLLQGIAAINDSERMVVINQGARHLKPEQREVTSENLIQSLDAANLLKVLKFTANALKASDVPEMQETGAEVLDIVEKHEKPQEQQQQAVAAA